jgi:hypothetical protein
VLVCLPGLFYFVLTLSEQDTTELRKSLQNRMLHCFKELRDLMGERLALLEEYSPVDTASFHDRVSSLLVEKIKLLERLKLGDMSRVPAAPSSLP